MDVFVPITSSYTSDLGFLSHHSSTSLTKIRGYCRWQIVVQDFWYVECMPKAFGHLKNRRTKEILFLSQSMRNSYRFEQRSDKMTISQYSKAGAPRGKQLECLLPKVQTNNYVAIDCHVVSP